VHIVIETDEEINNFELIDSDSEPFALEDNVLRVTSPLDYETRRNYMVTVKAIDSRGGESTAKLAIKISDVNGYNFHKYYISICVIISLKKTFIL